MSEEVLFEEKQYLGVNKLSILRRMVLALFCFIAYYWSENPKPVDVSGIRIGAYPVQNLPSSGSFFFLMGVAILVISTLLVFVLHIHTLVTPTSITLDGLWTSRKVKIDFSCIIDAKKIPYSKYLMNRPVYNLHSKGRIRFYTSGSDAIELTDKDGLRYRIGSQKADSLLRTIQEQIEKHHAD